MLNKDHSGLNKCSSFDDPVFVVCVEQIKDIIFRAKSSLIEGAHIVYHHSLASLLIPIVKNALAR